MVAGAMIDLPDPGFAPTAPLWAGAAAGIFRLPRCTECDAFDWYPTGACPHCGGAVAWTALSGDATLFSWALVHRALHPALAPITPYLSAIVAIAENPATRFVTRLVDADLRSLRSELPVRVRFLDLGYPHVRTGVTAPLFTPARKDIEA